jgi:hypothetical protein
MDAKFLFAALFAVVFPLGTGADAAAPVEVSFPDVTVTVGEARGDWVWISTSPPSPQAEVEMRFDATGIASIAKVTTDTPGCATEANLITCRRKMNPDGSLALVYVTGHGQPGTGQIKITASVNGVWSEDFHSNVTVNHPAKLVLLGAKVKAPGQTKVPVTVGVRNVGKAPSVRIL